MQEESEVERKRRRRGRGRPVIYDTLMRYCNYSVMLDCWVYILWWALIGGGISRNWLAKGMDKGDDLGVLGDS